MPRERVPGRRDDHLVPVDRPRPVDDGNDQVDPGGERAVVPAQPLDDHRLRLLYDTDATRDDRDCEPHDRRRNDQRAHVVHAPCPPQLSLSTYHVPPSTRTTISRVPVSTAASISAAPP